MESNIRNIKIRILRVLIEKEMNLSDVLSLDLLRNDMYIREGELIRCEETLFDKVDGGYILNAATLQALTSYLENHNAVKEIDISKTKKEYITFFEAISTELYLYDIDEAMKYIEDIHWFYLPIYSDMMVNNRNISPEEDIKNYYNHYHSLQDMYKICQGKEEEWKSLKGDINLNKKLIFKVYTNRWGHYDHYEVKRTNEGWSAENISVGGSGNKDGENSFIVCFEQDYVAYPEEFKYMLAHLWELADSTGMEIEELQEKLDDLANLVSTVEKTVREYTPSWYR